MKAVFDTKPSSGYDDEVAQRYHFPNRYREVVDATVGDWVVLRRPRADGGNLAYFAIARVTRVDPDSSAPNRAYARLSDFLPFDAPVPWTAQGRYAEEALRGLPRPQVGVFLRGRSVRPLTDADFLAIASIGLRDTVDPVNAQRYGLSPDAPEIDAFRGNLSIEERTRKIAQTLRSRILRDASFRRTVCTAYDDRCAVTKLRIINGGGRSEVQAAHIWAVAKGGPDIIQNGVALTATVHWLFDRHLISFTDDYRILVAHNRIPDQLRQLFASQHERIHLPSNSADWPNLSYLQRHREVFAGA
jgi:putative restriction endonuclease